MLATIDAEKFSSGHSNITDRRGITNHIEIMENRHKKVKSLIEKNMNLDDIKSEFDDNEARLIETIYNEIKG